MNENMIIDRNKQNESVEQKTKCNKNIEQKIKQTAKNNKNQTKPIGPNQTRLTSIFEGENLNEFTYHKEIYKEVR